MHVSVCACTLLHNSPYLICLIDFHKFFIGLRILVLVRMPNYH